jgi:hypothetical protein
MIARWVIHLEAHRGYRPRLSIRRFPRPGDRVVDGGLTGTLVRCRECGDGLLHQVDPGQQPVVMPDQEPPAGG